MLFTCATSDTIRDTVDLYFEFLHNAIANVEYNEAIKASQKNATDKLFVSLLSKHRALYGLTRTNSKGFVLNDVTRENESIVVTKRPERIVHWSLQYLKKRKEYHGFKKEDGKYFLIWAQSIYGQRNNFTGSYVATIDLIECFSIISQKLNKPFAVRLINDIIYSFEWKNDPLSVSYPLSIVGVAGLSISYEHSALESTKKLPDTVLQIESIDLAQRSDSVESIQNTDFASKIHEFIQKNSVGAILIGVAVLLMFVVLLFYFYSWLNTIFNVREEKKTGDKYGRRS